MVEEHHEVLPYWSELRKALGRNLTLVHFDAHPDMSAPTVVAEDPRATMTANDNFILAAVGLGIVDRSRHAGHAA